MSVPFTIDGEEESIQINVGRSDLQLLKDTSPILRELIDGYDPHHRQPIQLFENKDEHVDITSIRYLLESIGLEAERQRTKQRITPQEEKKLKLKTANLSQQCNALHYLRCNPSPFLGLWDRQMQPWVSMPQPDRVWSWRIPGRDIREKLKTWPDYPGHSANAAYVLQKDDEFSDALRFLVWDSVMDAVPTAVQGLKDTGGLRLKYMKSLFSLMTTCLGAISNENHRIYEEIQKKINVSNNLSNLHLAASMRETDVAFPWDQSMNGLLGRTIYGFAMEVDMALLKGTSLEHKTENYASLYIPMPTVSSSASSLGLATDSDATSVRGTVSFKSLSRLHWTPVIQGARSLFGQENNYIDKVKMMLDHMDKQIRQDQEALITELLGAREEGYYLGAVAGFLAGDTGTASVTPGGGSSPEVKGKGKEKASSSQESTSATEFTDTPATPYMTPANGSYAPGSSTLRSQYGNTRLNGKLG